MPIRVRIERVGIYKQYPDKIIYDFEIERLDDIKIIDEVKYRKYKTIEDKEFWHPVNTGIEKLVEEALERINKNG